MSNGRESRTRNVQLVRGGLVWAHGLLYHSTQGSSVMKKVGDLLCLGGSLRSDMFGGFGVQGL